MMVEENCLFHTDENFTMSYPTPRPPTRPGPIRLQCAINDLNREIVKSRDAGEPIRFELFLARRILERAMRRCGFDPDGPNRS